MDNVARHPLSPEVIIGAAERLVDDGTAAPWSVRALSRVLDCTPGALYRHFPGGSAEIAAEVKARDFAQLERALAAAEDDPGAPGLASLSATSHAARLARRMRAYLAFAETNPTVYQILFGPARGGLEPGANEAAERAMIGRPAEIMQGAARARELARPRIGGTDASLIAAMIWGQLHGFADLRLGGLAGDRLDGMEIRLMVTLLSYAGFTVAATPAGLEAAARAAEGRGAVRASDNPAPDPHPGATQRVLAAFSRHHD